MSKGKFISIEGIEGAGKSTALTYIKQYLQQTKKEVVWTREPGGTALAETIRQWLLYPQSDEMISAQAELLLMFASRAQHMQHVILPALQASQWVVSDRFIDASYAYQGGGRGIARQDIEYLDQWIVGEHRPDLTLLLDVSPDLGALRAEKRGMQKDRIEKEKNDFFMRVRHAYLEQAQQEPERIKIIDATRPLLEVEKQILAILNKWMATQ